MEGRRETPKMHPCRIVVPCPTALSLRCRSRIRQVRWQMMSTNRACGVYPLPLFSWAAASGFVTPIVSCIQDSANALQILSCGGSWPPISRTICIVMLQKMATRLLSPSMWQHQHMKRSALQAPARSDQFAACVQIAAGSTRMRACRCHLLGGAQRTGLPRRTGSQRRISSTRARRSRAAEAGACPRSETPRTPGPRAPGLSVPPGSAGARPGQGKHRRASGKRLSAEAGRISGGVVGAWQSPALRTVSRVRSFCKAAHISSLLDRQTDREERHCLR
eukprot:SAG22_NODE_511_length_9594_cov_4.553449_4_plen_277_part_00